MHITFILNQPHAEFPSWRTHGISIIVEGTVHKLEVCHPVHSLSNSYIKRLLLIKVFEHIAGEVNANMLPTTKIELDGSTSFTYNGYSG